jgi:MftR C-terminal domain
MLAQTRGGAVDELEIRVVIAALGVVIATALELWLQDDGRGDLLAIFDRLTQALVEGVSDLAA